MTTIELDYDLAYMPGLEVVIAPRMAWRLSDPLGRAVFAMIEHLKWRRRRRAAGFRVAPLTRIPEP